MDKRFRRVLDMSLAELKAARKAERKANVKAGIPLERTALGRWKKGISGNSLGRPRIALSVLCREQITKHGLVGILGAIASRSGDYGPKYKNRDVLVTPADQIAAIKLLLTYGYGLPKAELDTGDVKIEVTYDNRSVTIANAAPGPGENHRGGKEIQHRLVREALRQDDAGPGPADSPSAGR